MLQTSLEFLSDKPEYKAKMKSDDRVLVLRPMEGKSALTTGGMTDNRLFKEGGGNRLHAVRDPNTSLWKLYYDQGALPPKLQIRFTSFNKLMTYVNNYYHKRNLHVANIID